MTRKYETGYVWKPMQSAKDWRWVRALCVIAVSLAIGFVAGRASFWTTRSASTERPDAMAKAKEPSALPVLATATRPQVPQAPAASALQEAPAYVIINPGAVKDGSETQPRRDVTHGAKENAKRASPDRVQFRSGVKMEREEPRDNAPAPDYRALRDYVLKQ